MTDLTVAQINYLSTLGRAVRDAPNLGEHTGAIALALVRARAHRLDGVPWRPIAVALGVELRTLRVWIDARAHQPAASTPPVPADTVVFPPPDQHARTTMRSVTASISPSTTSSGSISISGSASVLEPPSTIGMQPRVVLVVSGDPRPGGNNFGLETAEIRRQVWSHGIEVRDVACAEFTELSDALDRYQPWILHISAHSAYGGLYLTLDGSPVCLHRATIIAAITESGSTPHLTVLNVCGSAPIAEAVGLPAIGWTDLVDDEQTRLFSRELYRSLVMLGEIRPSFARAHRAVTSVWPDIDPVLHDALTV